MGIAKKKTGKIHSVCLEDGSIIESDKLQNIFRSFISDLFYLKRREINDITRYLTRIELINKADLPNIQPEKDNGYGYGSGVYGGSMWRVEYVEHMYPSTNSIKIYLASKILKDALIKNINFMLIED